MIKVLKILGIVIAILISGLSIYIYSSGPELPADTNKIIDMAVGSELPKLIRGETGIANNGNVHIWYESISPKDFIKGSIILVMGIANDSLAWPEYFVQPLVDSGFRVIRYDHRGTGLSDWIEKWDRDNPYSLGDMANDAIAVLNKLKIEKVHVIGVSMGGMIAQTLAINHPERIISIASLMSSGYIEDPNLEGISKDLVWKLIKLHLKYGLIKTDRNTIKMHISARQLLMGSSTASLDLKNISTQVLYNIRKRKGYNDKASEQHIAATSLSGSRYKGLKQLRIPTIIIHGKSDPFIPFKHGIKCSELIPNSDVLLIEGMGHDIPKEFALPILNAIIKNINKAKNPV
jgi:pimeloyl-ACP methyl ester carboxylesterase